MDKSYIDSSIDCHYSACLGNPLCMNIWIVRINRAMTVIMWCISVLFLSVFANEVNAASYSVGKSKGCENYADYKPSDDIEVQEGKDAKGWGVAPADLHASAIGKENFDPVDIAIDIPVADYVNQDNYNVNLSESRIWAGRVQVGQDGKTTFNDTELKAQPYLPDCGE